MLDDLWQAARSVARRPAISALLILLLALCIGGNTAVFSAIDAALLQDSAYQSPDLVMLTGRQMSTGENHQSVAWLDIEDWQRRAKSFATLAPFFPWEDRILVGDDSSEIVQTNYVPPSYFELVGARTELGRLFNAEENVVPDCCRVAVLSYDLWQRRFGRDPKVLGTKIQLNSEIYTVIGVMARSFRDFPQAPRPLDLWVPAAVSRESNREGMFTDRTMRAWYVIGRLKPGVTLAQARQEMDAIGAQLSKEFQENEDYGVYVEPFREYAFAELDRSMQILLVGALLVLLIGCANVGNLLLVRALARRHEMSLRLAIGAGRQRLVRQMVFEALILAGLGGLLGLVIAAWGTNLLAGNMQVPPFVEIKIDLSVLAFFFAITLAAGLAFGLPPALRAARVDPLQSLQEGGRSMGGRSDWKLNTLVVAQVAVVSILLIGAGLLLKSFQRLRTVDLDYATERILLLQVDFSLAKYDERPRIAPVVREMLERVSGVQGVEQAITWGQGAPGVDYYYVEVTREEATADELPARADQNVVSPGALRMMGIPLLRGREFTEQDTADSTPVTLISKSLGEALWPGQDALGKRLRRRPTDPWYTVVGVFADVTLRARTFGREHDVMFVYPQRPVRDVNFLVRTTGDPASLGSTLRDVLAEVEPQVPVHRVITMAEILHQQETRQRFNATVMGLYAALALLLAVVGLYAVLSQGVLQRMREIGVRLALGAKREDVFSMVLTRGVGLIVAGLAIGLAAALALTHLMESLLYETAAKDLSTFVWVAVIFVGIGLVAVLLPARRAMRIEPATVLRHD